MATHTTLIECEARDEARRLLALIRKRSDAIVANTCDRIDRILVSGVIDEVRPGTVVVPPILTGG